ncbi:MAG: Na+/H+ antiporter NhaC family protein [Clostridia bacterium]
MQAKKKSSVPYIIAGVMIVAMFAIFAFTNGGNGAYQTFWSLVPPIVAIALALITKEVYSSLFIGILTGALLYSNLNPIEAFVNVFTGVEDADGAMVGGLIPKLADSWNAGILVFLVVLGIMVVLMNMAGGSKAYGDWARKKIQSRKGSMLSTFILGAIIFVDDYFNCLTVGSVMRPVTDNHKISRAKLSYIIDATAAPICIIAPISSWAAAVTGVVEGYNGLDLFIRSIPYNLYAILTIIMVVFISSINLDYGPMKKHEENAKNGDIYTTEARPYANVEAYEVSGNGKVIDLVLPVILLIFSCIAGMVYTGGFFDSGSENYMNFITSFSNCDASVGLVLGSVFALICTFLFYIPRKVLTFEKFMSAFPEGFKAMVPAILILSFAWTLSGVTNNLGAPEYVAALLDSGAENLSNFLPAIVFLVAMALAFSTGTSWGTFGILLPIVVPIFMGTNGEVSEILIITISACLAGAVCGDHCSPISDTTIMASTGAQCDHVVHVSTQIPYALTVASVSFVGYILAAFVQNAFVVLPVSIAILLAVLIGIKLSQKKKA